MKNSENTETDGEVGGEDSKYIDPANLYYSSSRELKSEEESYSDK